jgi:hypothetical protein
VDPEKQYPFLRTLLAPFHQWHRRTMGLIIAGIAVTGQARSFAVGTMLSRWRGTQLASGVNRLYRLLRNPRLRLRPLVTEWAKILTRRTDRELLIAVDWTDWHHGMKMLVAAVVAGRRAIPLYVEAFSPFMRRGLQSGVENKFIRFVADALSRAAVRATILCDRGFRRITWLDLLNKLGLGYVVRLKGRVYVEVAGRQLQLDDILITPGQLLDLGELPMREDGAVTTRVVGYWAPRAKEPWWLATNLASSPSRIVKLYDRRMTVEEVLRDTKGQRFGVKIAWTQFSNPVALSRFAMLVGVATLVWTVLGRSAAAQDRSLRMPCIRKGPRQSYITIGLRIAQFQTGLLRITTTTIFRWIEPPKLRRLDQFTVGGK